MVIQCIAEALASSQMIKERLCVNTLRKSALSHILTSIKEETFPSSSCRNHIAYCTWVLQRNINNSMIYKQKRLTVQKWILQLCKLMSPQVCMVTWRGKLLVRTYGLQWRRLQAQEPGDTCVSLWAYRQAESWCLTWKAIRLSMGWTKPTHTKEISYSVCWYQH